MSSSVKVTARMERRVDQLCESFGSSLDRFEATALFTGPSFYFHEKTLSRRRSEGLASVLEDDLWFDYLYATLTAWGLHRMGPGNTKLRDIEELRTSVRAQAAALETLEDLRITSLTEKEASSIAPQVWAILTALKVSVAKAQLVANSKALHHLLPGLVPPIDREYTFRFFYSRTMLSIPEREAFLEIYEQLHRVAARGADEILRRVGSGWHTSESKVIDNAVIGYMVRQARRLNRRKQASL